MVKSYRKRGLNDENVTKHLLEEAKKDSNGCLISPYPPFDYKRLPYSRIRVRGELVLTHRFIYEQTRGYIPDGMIVMHTCDNATCINPAHLRLGTQTDNIRDRDAKGRSNRAVGDRNFNTRLQASDIPKIVREIKLGRSMSKVGAEFGVSATAICAIVNGKTWKHVPR